MGSSNSTESTSGCGQMPLLPNECLLLILRECQGSTLKNFRLSSKAFRKLAEPLLWQDVRLVPNVDCLNSVHSLMSHSHLAFHVQNVIYDASWEYLIDDFRIRSEKPAFKAKSSIPGKETWSCGKILQQCVQNQIRSGEDSPAEVACLSRLLSLFPNLRALAVKETATTFEILESMPYYYKKVCKEAGLPTTDIRLSGVLNPVDSAASHTRNFLLAAYSTGRGIDYVDLRAVSWHTFFRSPLHTTPGHLVSLDFRVRQDLFSNISQLDLSFRGSPSRDPCSDLKPLRELLKSCEKLEGLYLSFTNIVNHRRYSTDHRSFSYLSVLLGENRSVRPLMPRLRELFLNSTFCTQQDLIHFLAAHASTLQHVSLSNMSMLRNENKDGRGCWVKVIKAMKSLLRLKTVYFSGWLSNGGRQIWHVSEDGSDDDRLRPAVVRYITDRSISLQQCPLDHVAILPDQEDLEKPASGWVEGDWTWTMTYQTGKTRAEQTHSGTELFTKNVPLESDEWAIANPQFWKTPYKKTYPAYHGPYPSKKTSPNPSNWSWSDYDVSTTWPLPSSTNIKAKQKVPSPYPTFGNGYPMLMQDPFSFGAPASSAWDDQPAVQENNLSTSKTSTSPPHSDSSYASASQAASSFTGGEMIDDIDGEGAEHGEVDFKFPDMIEGEDEVDEEGGSPSPPPPPLPLALPSTKFQYTLKPPSSSMHGMGSSAWSQQGMVSSNHNWGPGASNSLSLPSKYAYKGAIPAEMQFLSTFEPFTSPEYTENWPPNLDFHVSGSAMADISKDAFKAQAQAHAHAQALQASAFGYQLHGPADMKAPGGTFAGMQVFGGGMVNGGLDKTQAQAQAQIQKQAQAQIQAHMQAQIQAQAKLNANVAEQEHSDA